MRRIRAENMSIREGGGGGDWQMERRIRKKEVRK